MNDTQLREAIGDALLFPVATYQERVDSIHSLFSTDNLLSILKERLGVEVIVLDKPQAVCKNCERIWYDCSCEVKMYVREGEV